MGIKQIEWVAEQERGQGKMFILEAADTRAANSRE